jgi:uncharacterized protein (TIGR02246 family)
MRELRFTCLVLLACVATAQPALCRADQTEDEAAIRKNDDAYVQAYNKHDAKALAALWSPEAVYVDPETGDEFVGREEIEKEFTDTFADLKDAKLEITASSVKFLSPNVAVETGTARVISPNAEPDESNYSALFVKRDGTWLLDRVTEEGPPEEPEAPPQTGYDHLKDLEWMVGSWIDQDENATIQTDCDWTKNQNFLHRSFAVVIGDNVDMAGLQIIGWDASAKQIRSWVFDSDGGFYEGKWTRKGDRWVINQTGVLPDGRKSSEVNIVKRVDDNSFTWRSVERSVDGDLLPNVDEVLIVRKGTQTAAVQ